MSNFYYRLVLVGGLLYLGAPTWAVFVAIVGSSLLPEFRKDGEKYDA